MTKREAFIKFVDSLIVEAWPDVDSFEKGKEEWSDAFDFFEEFKAGKVKESKEITENGKKLLTWMQENVETKSNIFTSKEAAEALFTSGRSIAGSMRKLVSDGYVEKMGKNPVQYSLTEKGKLYTIIDN